MDTQQESRRPVNPHLYHDFRRAGKNLQCYKTEKTLQRLNSISSGNSKH